MSERDKARMIWVVLLLLFLFCMLIAGQGAQSQRGAERLKHEAMLSRVRAEPYPILPALDGEAPKISEPMSVILAWNPSPSTNVLCRYELGYGPATSTYTNLLSAGLNLTITIGGLDRTGRYYLAVRAVADQWTNQLSEWSGEIKLDGRPKTNRIVNLWTSLTNWTPVLLTNPVPNFFYRTKTTKLSANRYRTVAQRTPALLGPWEDWTNYWAPLTNTIPSTVRLFSKTWKE